VLGPDFRRLGGGELSGIHETSVSILQMPICSTALVRLRAVKLRLNIGDTPPALRSAAAAPGSWSASDSATGSITTRFLSGGARQRCDRPGLGDIIPAVLADDPTAALAREVDRQRSSASQADARHGSAVMMSPPITGSSICVRRSIGAMVDGEIMPRLPAHTMR